MRRSVVVLAVLILLSPGLNAQNSAVGASYTLLSLTYPDQIPNGFGAWFSRDLAAEGPAIGFDAAVSFFPEDHPIIGRQTQLLGGVRAGLRGSRFGAFGRVRPGLVHFTERFLAPDTVCILIFPPPDSCLVKSTNAALDLGGTAEFYPTVRSIVRLDFGDTLIRFSRTSQEAVWKHNFQFAAGAGLRF